MPVVEPPKPAILETEGENILLRIDIISLSASRLMKFNKNLRIKEMIPLIVKKHRFTDPIESYELHHKNAANEELTLLDPMKKLIEYEMIHEQVDLLKECSINIW